MVLKSAMSGHDKLKHIGHSLYRFISLCIVFRATDKPTTSISRSHEFGTRVVKCSAGIQGPFTFRTLVSGLSSNIEQWGGNKMANDKMRNDEPNRNMGGRGTEDEAAHDSRQTPGRNPQDDKSTGQRKGAGNQPSDDDELDEGGRQSNPGGQKR